MEQKHHDTPPSSEVDYETAMASLREALPNYPPDLQYLLNLQMDTAAAHNTRREDALEIRDHYTARKHAAMATNAGDRYDQLVKQYHRRERLRDIVKSIARVMKFGFLPGPR